MSTVIIQTRMSSSRLPGKVLKAINGKPVLLLVIEQCLLAKGVEQVIVATSSDCSDDPIESYCSDLGIICFRGDLFNVYERFKQCVRHYDLEHFVRICSDSPFIDPDLLKFAINLFHKHRPDLVTNVFPRSFPKGQSVEVIKSTTFLRKAYQSHESFSPEHITRGFYGTDDSFSIINFRSKHSCSDDSWAIDTQEDMLRLASRTSANSKPPKFQIAGFEHYGRI